MTRKYDMSDPIDREACMAEHWHNAEEQVARLSKALDEAIDLLKRCDPVCQQMEYIGMWRCPYWSNCDQLSCRARDDLANRIEELEMVR